MQAALHLCRKETWLEPHPAQCLDKGGRALQKGKKLGVDGVSEWVSQDACKQLIHFYLLQGHRPVAVLPEEGGRALCGLAGLVCVPPVKSCIQQGGCSSVKMHTRHCGMQSDSSTGCYAALHPNGHFILSNGHFILSTVLVICLLQGLKLKVYCILSYKGNRARAHLHAA